MSETVTIPAIVWRNLLSDIKFLKEAIVPLAKGHKPSQWMFENEVMEVTGLSKSSLKSYRKKMVFNWSTGTGRKIKYLRKDVEAFLNNNSTQRA
ncbi:MAG: helix-turn-helix domain-containing protein [Ferruginibacter sp.]